MERMTVKATTTQTTDLGEFTALVSTYDRDREGDRVEPGAFAHSIWEWREVGKRVPVHWNHHADQIVGDADPEEMWETDDGLQISGKIDLDDELGRKVWKSVKKNRIGFSFGYLTKRSREREDGGKDLLELDVFEISATPSPMNNRTRVLSTKSIDEQRYELPDGQIVDYQTMVTEGPKVAAQRRKARKAARPIQIARFKVK